MSARVDVLDQRGPGGGAVALPKLIAIAVVGGEEERAINVRWIEGVNIFYEWRNGIHQAAILERLEPRAMRPAARAIAYSRQTTAGNIFRSHVPMGLSLTIPRKACRQRSEEQK